MPDALPRTVFLGRGNGAICWYRVALPAMHLGLPWVGIAGEPDALLFGAGLTDEHLDWEALKDFEVVVLQYQGSRGWLRGIRELQSHGVKVLVEIDDYMHSVRRKKDHPLAKQFGRDFLESLELCMRVADGIICSQEWLGRRYRSYNPNVWVCRNGIDLNRYALTRVPSEHVTIGWAGGIGHDLAAEPWLAAIAEVLELRPQARFTSVGQPLAARLAPRFGEERSRSIPWSAFETYPAAMRAIDIAVAPAADTAFYRGKSDLRWLEASALGTPLVADPDVYPEMEHGVTGFHAATPAEVRDQLLALVDDADMRERVGAAAKAHVVAHRSSAVAAEAWRVPLTEVLETSPRGRARAGVR